MIHLTTSRDGNNISSAFVVEVVAVADVQKTCLAGFCVFC